MPMAATRLTIPVLAALALAAGCGGDDQTTVVTDPTTLVERVVLNELKADDPNGTVRHLVCTSQSSTRYTCLAEGEVATGEPWDMTLRVTCRQPGKGCTFIAE